VSRSAPKSWRKQNDSTWPLDQGQTLPQAGEAPFEHGYHKHAIHLAQGEDMRAIIMVSIIFLTFLGLFVPKKSSYPSAILIGGEYTVQSGETRSGDMLLLFTHVKVDQGGQVDGSLHVFGSDLQVSGYVSGDIVAYGSRVTVEIPAAQIDGTINNLGSLRELPKFPSFLLVIS
jgi:hypothetical protein